jgi:hypothetical protein
MLEMSALRELDHTAIDKTLNSITLQRQPNFGGSWRHTRAITDENRANCHALCDWLLTQQNYKLVISQDCGYFYSNDLATVRIMEQLSYLHPLRIKQAQISRLRGTLLIRNSTHEFRTYLKPGRVSDQEKLSLKNFLQNQDNIRLGPSLIDFFQRSNKYHYINDNFFIDHDGLGILTMLSLVRSNCVKKTLMLIRNK